MSKFKVGQKVRLKSHEELKRIGVRANIEVHRDFTYSLKYLLLLFREPILSEIRCYLNLMNLYLIIMIGGTMRISFNQSMS